MYNVHKVPYMYNVNYTIQVQYTLFSRYPAAKLIIYTGDTDAAPDMILAKVQCSLCSGQ